MRPAARALRSCEVRASDSNGARFGSYGQRDGDFGAAGERLEERPLRARQVLEPVREDGPIRPRLELCSNALGRMPAEQVTVPEPQLVQLHAIRRIKEREISGELRRLDEPGLELRERRPESVREAREA